MRVTAVMAHPDDAEIWCGGTLALHTAAGDEVTISILSHDGASARGREALLGAERLGCSLHLLGLKDTAIRDTDDTVVKVKSIIDKCRPQVILTHWFDDMHPDHEATCKAVIRAVLSWLQQDEAQDMQQVPRLFCCDTYDSLGLRGPFIPNRFVDVDAVWTLKMEAIQAHESQFLSRYLPMIEGQCRSHGKAVGIERAEGFLFVPLFGREDDGEPLGRSGSFSRASRTRKQPLVQ